MEITCNCKTLIIAHTADKELCMTCLSVNPLGQHQKTTRGNCKHTPLLWIILQNAIEHRHIMTHTNIFPSWSHIMGEHVKTAQRRLSTTRAFPSPSNPAIRDKAREMEQMFHKWEWQRESWPSMVFLISQRRTRTERKAADTLLQHRLRSNSNDSRGCFQAPNVGFAAWEGHYAPSKGIVRSHA